jgi:GTP cyclohydrolase II
LSGPQPSIHAALLRLDARKIETVFGDFELTAFRNLAVQRECFALHVGDVQTGAPLLARVHSSCVTSEFYGACDCDCAAQLDGALEAIAAEGRGILFYLAQEGRGAGLTAKARDRMMVQASRQRLTTFEAYEQMGFPPDMRRYEEVAAMANLLGIRAPFVLLSNNPDKAASLEREKLRIDRLQPIEHAPSPFNVHYLAAKRRTGHVLADAPEMLDAELPMAVETVEPAPLPGAPSLVRLARYLLPVCGRRGSVHGVRSSHTEGPVWLCLHLYVDTHSGAEVVVLTLGEDDSRAPLVHLQAETHLDRLPLRSAPGRESWLQAATRMVSVGAGVVVSGPEPPRGVVDEARQEEISMALFHHHLGGRPALIFPSQDGRELGRRLGARGVVTESVESATDRRSPA